MANASISRRGIIAGVAVVLAGVCGCQKSVAEDSKPKPPIESSAADASDSPDPIDPKEAACKASSSACIAFAGDAMRCVDLGADAEEGRGRKADPKLAANLYQAACDADVALGCGNLGALTENKLQKFEDAATLYQKACSLGDANGCTLLANLYDQGKGVAPERAHAIDLWKQACKANSGQACHNLGTKYRNGDGVERDASIALKYDARACNLGNAGSCNNAAIALSRGDGAPQDMARAIKLTEVACKLGNPAACRRMQAAGAPPPR